MGPVYNRIHFFTILYFHVGPGLRRRLRPPLGQHPEGPESSIIVPISAAKFIACENIVLIGVNSY